MIRNSIFFAPKKDKNRSLALAAVLLLAFCSFSTCSKTKESVSLSLLNASLEEARNQGQRLVVLFGADWCPDCRAFEQMLNDRKVSELTKAKFLFLKIDVGQFDKNLELNAYLGNPIAKGIPAVVILDPFSSGKILVSTEGGEFSEASKMKPEQILSFFQKYSNF
ncbi:thioredoxin domain protein [Leptospira ryugenii]|uniref:Thioredoxin domain protein n=1 Tax=Leptospira ryugenii TaxID=1917863 RepID=A0A2P2E2K5_9LEPT|nr:thioredoxin family protein [Leptospira ryugenii]GBF51118.1 thioredoxin domain protein [Leptospira ryugenii]